MMITDILTLKLKNILDLNNVLKSVIDNKDLKIDALLKFQFLGILNKIGNNIENNCGDFI